jgi:hypothetical protein
MESYCYLSKGQNTELTLPEGEDGPRENGDRIELNGAKMIPEESHSYLAHAYFWLKARDCKLIYDIELDSTLAGKETGTHIYGLADASEVAGVITTLPSGIEKKGEWNFCADGVTPQQLLSGRLYVVVYTTEGAMRGQIEFEENCALPSK